MGSNNEAEETIQSAWGCQFCKRPYEASLEVLGSPSSSVGVKFPATFS